MDVVSEPPTYKRRASLAPIPVTIIGLILLLVLLGAALNGFGSYKHIFNELSVRCVDLAHSNGASDSVKAVQLACHHFFVPFNQACPRVLSYKITSAGLGHQMSELLFGLRKAQTFELAYMFEPFVQSHYHKANFTFVNDLLGLPALFAAIGGPTRDSVDTLMAASNSKWTRVNNGSELNNTGIARTCESYVQLGGFKHCEPNCFASRETANLLQDASECLRTASRELGTAFGSCIFLDDATDQWLPADTLVVVWHVRTGDITLHPPDDTFYPSVLRELRGITTGYNVRIQLVGNGQLNDDGTSTVSPDYVTRIHSLAADVWLGSATSESITVVAPRYNFRDAFVAMMQADVLVGSGSSLPTMASLFSDIPLFLNHVPKHGYNFGLEMMVDSVDMAGNGTILESRRRLCTEVHARMHPTRPTVCRKPSLRSRFHLR